MAFRNMIENSEMHLLDTAQWENELVRTRMKHNAFIFQAEVV